jgi:hypothetical protein
MNGKSINTIKTPNKNTKWNNQLPKIHIKVFRKNVLDMKNLDIQPTYQVQFTSYLLWVLKFTIQNI